jgi:site-specific DNA-adenine methylase
LNLNLGLNKIKTKLTFNSNTILNDCETQLIKSINKIIEKKNFKIRLILQIMKVFTKAKKKIFFNKFEKEFFNKKSIREFRCTQSHK